MNALQWWRDEGRSICALHGLNYYFIDPRGPGFVAWYSSEPRIAVGMFRTKAEAKKACEAHRLTTTTREETA